MAEALADHVHRLTGLEQDRGVAVPQIMKPDRREIEAVANGAVHGLPPRQGEMFRLPVVADPAGALYAAIGSSNLRAWADTEAAGHLGLAN